MGLTRQTAIGSGIRCDWPETTGLGLYSWRK